MMKRLLLASFVACALSACSGGGAPPGSAVPQAQPPASGTPQAPPGASLDVALGPTTSRVALPLSGAFTGTISLHATGVQSGAMVTISASEGEARGPSRTCPPFPIIHVRNPFRFPIELDIDALTFKLPCVLSNALFGVSLFQSVPMPAVVSPVKLGDVTVSGREFSFVPSVGSVTLAARTISDLVVLPETSTAAVALPAAPGATSVLTANAPAVPPLQLSYSTSSGASLYSSACFPAFESDGSLNPALAGIQILGIPNYFCTLAPENGSSITFGTQPTFAASLSKPDVGLLEFDGPIVTSPCTPSGSNSETCTTPQFTVSSSGGVQNVIVSNARDLAACVPTTLDADCNAAGATSGATSLARNSGAQQLLVADDPSYLEPAFGGYSLQVAAGSACYLNVGPDTPGNYPDFPPGYYDPQANPGATTSAATYPGDLKAGSAEFDVATGSATGTCAITITESTGLQRALTFSLPVE